MSEAEEFDLVTIGAGSGGVRGSRFASSYGAKVAVCEMPFDYKSSDSTGGVGGTCVLRGCVPKKLMVYASEYADAFHGAAGFGWQSNGAPSHDWGAMLAAKRKELQRLNGAYKNTLNNAKVELIEGRGRVVDAHTVEVGGRRVTAANILIAVGGRPHKLNIPGAEHAITSDDALELEQRPDKITVIGGGYIAVEFAGIFQRFGSQVHLAYRAAAPLRGFDDDLVKFATEQYAQSGLNLHPGFKPQEIRKQPNGKLTVVFTDKEGKSVEVADNDQVLMATGRVPNTRGLGLEEAGVQMGGKGEVVVDEYLRTSVPSIWALGDVINRVQLTPVALMEGMALAKTVVLNQPTKPDYWAIPSAVFSNPEIATVGMTEAGAVSAGHKDLDIYTTSFKPMRNTLSGSPLRTFMKLIVDANSRKVIGVHMAGDHAAEIMQGFAVAVKVGVSKEDLDSVVGIHPSAAEEFVTMRSRTRRVAGKGSAVPAAPGQPAKM
uniref:Glutathione-disulfide reductase n=1 Tax=Chlamydomonas leiostraca TaxID=1034604 RepID=A0A7S0WML1_9CHLO|mmetsp:Transcript_19230/g.48941  ORF Transcript_19230/g.48941 Transcript_19230/m.48941 type:complete len:489 (+) Transcript_19230:241-1707(+)